MKLLKLSFLFVLILSVAACNEDEPEPTPTPTCPQSDWLGTYSGKVSCDGDPEEDVVFTITAGQSDSIIVAYDENGWISTLDPIAPNGCSFVRTGNEFGLTGTQSISLDGDNLTYSFLVTNDSTSAVIFDCVYTTTRD